MYSDVGNTFASDMIPFRLLVMLINSSCWEIMPEHLCNSFVCFRDKAF